MASVYSFLSSVICDERLQPGHEHRQPDFFEEIAEMDRFHARRRVPLRNYREFARHRLAQLRGDLQRNTNSHGATACVICFEDQLVAASHICCSQHHAICRSCFTDYFPFAIRELERNLSDYRGFLCPFTDIDSENMTGAVHGNEHSYDSNVIDEILTTAQISALKSLVAKVEMLKDPSLPLQVRLKLLFPEALMCGACKFGPVEHFGCSSLLSHHGEEVQTTNPSLKPTTVNNSCPKCGWLTASVEDWPLWDGTLHADFE